LNGCNSLADNMTIFWYRCSPAAKYYHSAFWQHITKNHTAESVLILILYLYVFLLYLYAKRAVLIDLLS